MATLIYAVARALAANFMWSAGWYHLPPSLRFVTNAPEPISASDRALAVLDAAAASERKEVIVWHERRELEDPTNPDGTSDISYADLPPLLQRTLRTIVEDYLEPVVESLSSEIERCFGTKTDHLSSSYARDEAFTISIGNTRLKFELVLKSAESGLAMEDMSVELSSSRWPMPYSKFSEDESEHYWEHRIFLEQSASLILAEVVSGIFYLPASRSGTLQIHKALASFFRRRVPLVGIGDLEVPRLTGVVADFIGNILTLERNREPATVLGEVASFLESKIIHGSVSMSGSSRINNPEIQYTRDGKDFELHRTSSMVSEWLPLSSLFGISWEPVTCSSLKSRSPTYTRRHSGRWPVHSPAVEPRCQSSPDDT